MTVEHDRDLDARILSALNEMWQKAFGSTEPLQVSTTLAEILNVNGEDPARSELDDYDFTDLCYLVSRQFGIELDREEWFYFIGGDLLKNDQQDRWKEFSCTWTIQSLIDLIRVRLPQTSFDPVNICGKDCAPAGIFLGLKTVAQSICGDDSEIAPSTPITGRIKGLRLQRFWNQARLLTTLELPHAKGRFTCSFLALFLLFMAGIVQNVFSLHFSLPAIFAVAIAIFSYGCFRAANDTTADDGALLERFAFTCRVPKQFHTFRDLAEYIANHRTTA